eukprot:389434-Rhodomonas_salina.1
MCIRDSHPSEAIRSFSLSLARSLSRLLSFPLPLCRNPFWLRHVSNPPTLFSSAAQPTPCSPGLAYLSRADATPDLTETSCVCGLRWGLWGIRVDSRGAQCGGSQGEPCCISLGSSCAIRRIVLDCGCGVGGAEKVCGVFVPVCGWGAHKVAAAASASGRHAHAAHALTQ